MPDRQRRNTATVVTATNSAAVICSRTPTGLCRSPRASRTPGANTATSTVAAMHHGNRLAKSAGPDVVSPGQPCQAEQLLRWPAAARYRTLVRSSGANDRPASATPKNTLAMSGEPAGAADAALGAGGNDHRALRG